MQFKLISAGHQPKPVWRKGTDPAQELEQAVNAWFAANPGVEIVRTQYHTSGGNGWNPLTHYVAVWYRPAG
jgi:hypothetical protein